jgi:methylmalonyl-CoA/ethylmalonyl-CoA epimerase
MIGRLNHVGVAVPSIDEAKANYRDLYGVPESDMTGIRDMPAQGVRVAFVNMPNSQIELIEPLGETSPIVNFLKNNPRGGQHHVCFEVKDIHEAAAAMKAKGATVLGEPRTHGNAEALMNLLGLAVYILLWWLAFFTMLPLGVRNAAESGEENGRGHDHGAPVRHDLPKKALYAAGIAAVLWAIGFALLKFGVVKLYR